MTKQKMKEKNEEAAVQKTDNKLKAPSTPQPNKPQTTEGKQALQKN